MRSPTPRLVAGLLFTLAVTGGYAAYTLHSVGRMRELQTSIVDRNRRGSLQLIRVQNDLSALGLAMRDMLENADGYPLWAWQAPLARIRQNLDDATAGEGITSPYFRSSLADFWRAADGTMAMAKAGKDAEARAMVRNTLQPRQEALTALTARLLVEKNDEDARGAQQASAIHAEIETNAYRFLAVTVALLVLTGAGLVRSNRALFSQLAELAEQRQELARQLIATQESTLRAVSRDLHDEFGQILTALGAMLGRANRLAPDTQFREQVQESAAVVQGTLEKIRSLSQTLQPVMLEEQGLLPALEWHLSVFERQTGVKVHYTPAEIVVPQAHAVHVFRILQESLNNVGRHSGADEVFVSLGVTADGFTMTVEDHGRGIEPGARPGLGLAAMRERAGLIGGTLDIRPAPGGGTRITLHGHV